MRSALIISLLSALSIAAPRPQDLNFDEIDAAPDAVVVSPPTNVTVDNVATQPAAVASAIAAAAVSDVATTDKRDLEERDGDCSSLPAGTGPTVTT